MKTAGMDMKRKTTASRKVSAGAARRFVLPCALVAALSCTGASAQDNAAGAVELWLADAPLALVLEQIAGRDGSRVVIGGDVDGRVDGRLDGTRETVLATLAVEHELSVHADGDTVWFDPADRPVVSLVRLASPEAERALAELRPELAEGRVAQGTAEGIVLSGSRAFVESARQRIAALEPADAARSRRVRSISDIPGYDVDYTDESAS